MNTTTTTSWGYQATTGSVARSRWSAVAPMPSNFVAKANEHHGIRHRPPEVS